MKKFTLFLGVLLISMVSMAAEATISFADVANRKTLTDDQQVWEQNGLIVTGNKSASTTNVADYSNPARFYQGSSLTIKCTLGNITKIVIDGNNGKPVSGIQESIGDEATLDGNMVTVIPTETSDTYVIEKFTAQVRINAITVTYAAAGETPETPEEPENPEEPEQPNDSVDTPELPEGAITCAEAVAICQETGETATSVEYTVRGYVTNIKYAWSEKFGTATFWIADTKDGGDVLQAYNCAPLKDADKVFAVGAYVELVGKLKKYGTTNEVEKGTYTVITPAAGETPDDGGETPDDDQDGDGLWLLVTDASDLAAGDQIVVAASGTNVALSTNQKSNNRGQVDVTKNGNSLVINDDVQVITLEAGTKTGTYAFNVGNGYLYAASSSSNHLKTETTLSDNSSWAITITDEGVASVVAQGENTRNVMQYNETSTLFACYSSASQKPIALYKKTNSEGVVLAPAISGETNFLENTTVTITAEEGLEVYYTLDGTDPTKASTKYTAPFELTATTTVKAIAYNGDKASAVAEKKFSKMTILTCAEAVALCTNPATPGQHIIRGYITEVQEAYNEQYKNITFWMADAQDGENTLLAFRVKPVSDVEKTLKEGDFVEVIGSLILYSKDGVDTPEVNAGGSVKLITPGTTAVDNVTVNQQTTKFIQNGQLVILKNGVRYNAIGQVTK